MNTKGYGHGRIVLTLCGKEDTAEAHSSTSLRGLLAGDGSMWVLTKGGVIGDGGDLVKLILDGEPGPGIGYLEKSICGAPLSSASKLARGPMARAGEREPGDFLWTAFDRVGLLGGSVDIGGEDSLRDDRCGGLDGGFMCRWLVSWSTGNGCEVMRRGFLDGRFCGYDTE